MGSWVENFNTFQNSSGSISLPGGPPKQPQTKREKLEAELKLLQWHKLANEAAIKAALMQTKSIKDIKVVKQPTHTVEDAKWMKKIIDQERTKPLEVSKDFVLKYDKKEKERSEKLSDHVDRHISTLKSLRDKVEARHEVSARSGAYRNWRKDFTPKKNAVLLGKTLNSDLNLKSDTSFSANQENEIDKDINRYNRMPHQSATHASNKELSSVLNSLQQLSELENRISSLEQENVYDSLIPSTSFPDQIPTITSFQFKKQRLAPVKESLVGPVKVAYTLRTKKTAFTKPLTKVRKPLAIRNRTTFLSPRLNKASTVSTMQSGRGVFLTDIEATDNSMSFSKSEDLNTIREQRRRERQIQAALASDGQKGLRNRIHERKARQKEATTAARKHEEALQEIQRRRHEIQQRKAVTTQAYSGRVSKGASSGVRSNNKYLREVETMKNKMQRKQDELVNHFAKSSSNKLRLPSLPPRSLLADSSSESLASINRRAPTIKSTGTTTRRIGEVPVRRRLLGDDFDDFTESNPAVAGIAGLRVLKNMNKAIA